jgi:hypothetical protein
MWSHDPISHYSKNLPCHSFITFCMCTLTFYVLVHWAPQHLSGIRKCRTCFIHSLTGTGTCFHIAVIPCLDICSFNTNHQVNCPVISCWLLHCQNYKDMTRPRVSGAIPQITWPAYKMLMLILYVLSVNFTWVWLYGFVLPTCMHKVQ